MAISHNVNSVSNVVCIPVVARVFFVYSSPICDVVERTRSNRLMYITAVRKFRKTAAATDLKIAAASAEIESGEYKFSNGGFLQFHKHHRRKSKTNGMML